MMSQKKEFLLGTINITVIFFLLNCIFFFAYPWVFHKPIQLHVI